MTALPVTTDTSTARELVGRLVEAVHNGRRLDRLAEFYAPDHIEYDPRVGAGLADFWKELTARFPDLTVSLDRALADGSQVMAFLHWRGHDAADGKELRLWTSELFEVADGRIVMHAAVVDYCELAEFGIAPVRHDLPPVQGLAGPHTAREEANTAVVLAAYDEVMTQHLLDRADRYYQPGYLHHNAQIPAVPNGIASFKEFFAGNFARYPDLSVTAERVLCNGDLVMVFATWRGTCTGFSRGRVATGKKLEMRTSDLFHVVDGQVAEHWEVVDYSGLQRVGIPIRPPHHSS